MRSALVVASPGPLASTIVARLREHGCAVEHVAVLRPRAALDEAVAAARGRLDGLDLLVIATAPPAAGTIAATPDDAFCDAVEVGMSLPFRVARDRWADLRASGGSVVIVTADSAQRGDHGRAAVSVAAAGAVAVCELLAAEGAEVGVRANALCAAADDGAATAVAAAILWLGGAEATAVSGAVIRIDGAASSALRADTRG